MNQGHTVLTVMSPTKTPNSHNKYTEDLMQTLASPLFAASVSVALPQEGGGRVRGEGRQDPDAGNEPGAVD